MTTAPSTTPQAPPAPPLRDAMKTALRAAWANRYPALGLQCFAIAIGVSYALSPAVREALAHVADFKDRGGVLLAMASTAVFGGLIPWLIQRLRPATRPAATLEALAFLVGLWAVKGVEVDLFYRMQAVMFGSGGDARTLIIKTLFDQGLYSPIWAIGSILLLFRWRAGGYRLAALRDEVRGHGGLWRWYRHTVLPIVLPNAAVWVPAVIVIYQLPLPLQLPIQNLVLCFWSIILIVLAGRREDRV